MRVELPDGGWAELADPVTVSERKRRPLKRALAASSGYRVEHGTADVVTTAGVEVDLTDAVYDTCILALVATWSYGEVTEDLLADLPGNVYDALRVACFELLPQLLPRFEVDADPKEALTTTNSSG